VSIVQAVTEHVLVMPASVIALALALSLRHLLDMFV
jgi:hypothetical protein